MAARVARDTRSFLQAIHRPWRHPAVPRRARGIQLPLAITLGRSGRREFHFRDDADGRGCRVCTDLARIIASAIAWLRIGACVCLCADRNVLLGVAVQQRMRQLAGRLDHEPEEKARLYSAFQRVDPSRRGSIHVEQLADLTEALALSADITKEAMSALEAPSGIIHLDEFQSWYAERQLHADGRFSA